MTDTIYLSQLGFATFGCDISPVAIQTAITQVQQARASAELLVADLCRLPFIDNQFAAVICVHALPFHLKSDIANIVQEFRRVLCPDGWLHLDLLNHNSED